MGGRGGKGNVNGFIDWLSKEGKGGGSPHPLDISKFGNMRSFSFLTKTVN